MILLVNMQNWGFFLLKLRVIFWFGAKLLNFRALSKKKLEAYLLERAVNFKVWCIYQIYKVKKI